MPTWYETTLKTQIENDADIVLDTWGETVTRRICGDEDDTESILAAFMTDAEIQGDLVGDDANGRRVTKEAEFEVKSDQAITLNDVLVRSNGEVWSVVAIPARDDGMKTVIGRKTDGGTSKRARVRP